MIERETVVTDELELEEFTIPYVVTMGEDRDVAEWEWPSIDGRVATDAEMDDLDERHDIDEACIKDAYRLAKEDEA